LPGLYADEAGLGERLGAEGLLVVLQGTLQEAHDLCCGVDAVAAPAGYFFEYAFTFEGSHQPAGGLEGEA
jgi:hypothetical protein